MTDHAVVAQFKDCAMTNYMVYHLSALNLGQLSHQTAQPGLAVGTLAQEELVLPPLALQRSIVTHLDAARERCDKIKAEAEKGLKAAENLRKAILKEAFEQ